MAHAYKNPLIRQDSNSGRGSYIARRQSSSTGNQLLSWIERHKNWVLATPIYLAVVMAVAYYLGNDQLRYVMRFITFSR